MKDVADVDRIQGHRGSRPEHVEKRVDIEVDQVRVAEDVANRVHGGSPTGTGPSTTLPGCPLIGKAHPQEGQDHREETGGIDPERGRAPVEADEQSGNGGADHSRDLEAHHVERDRLPDQRGASEVGGKCLQGRTIKGRDDTRHHGKDIQVPELDQAGLDKDCQGGSQTGEDQLRAVQELAAIDPVGKGAGVRTEEEQWQGPEHRHGSKGSRRVGQFIDNP